MFVEQQLLTDEEMERFGWQIMIPEFGVEAQQKLKGASAFISRVGGLGEPAALYLAMAGIGKLVIAHGGLPELGHMNRWILSPYDRVGTVSPVISSAEWIKKLNPSIEIVGYEESINKDNVEDLVSQVDIVLDCPPWFEDRDLLNREAVRQRKPMIEAAVYGVEGYITTIIPGETPCLSCLNLQSKEWQLPFPVLGAVPGMLGSMMAFEAIKVLTGYGKPLLNTLLVYDGKTTNFRKIKVSKNPECPVCASILSQGMDIRRTKNEY